MTISSFQLGKMYQFELLAPAILGTRVSNLKYEGMIGYDIATRFDTVSLKHTQVLPNLPPGTIQDAKNLVYHSFAAENGGLIIYADVWIVPDSVQEVGTKTVAFLVALSDLASINQITTILQSAGFPVTSYTVQ